MERSVALVRSGSVLALTYSNLERVRVAAGNVVVEVESATICEADRRVVSGSKRIEGMPHCTTLGHEAVGRVVAVGKDVKGIKKGDFVAIMPHQVPEAERAKEAFRRGEIFKLHTQHAGMHVCGTIANHVEWPAEWVRVLPRKTIAKAKLAAQTHGLHWSLPLAEIEHLACVMTSVEYFEHGDQIWAESRNVRAMQSGAGNMLLVGAGWMSHLYHLHWKRRFPLAKVAIKDVDESRLRMFQDLSEATMGVRPEVVHGLDKSAESKFDVVVMATAARPAALDLFRFVKSGGHVILFSGIHNGATDLVFDPTKLSDLERIHRDGICAPVFRTPLADHRDMVVASGTSGYQVSNFDRATREIADYAPGIGAGITGVVLGMESAQLLSVKSGASPLLDAHGMPVLPTLFAPRWPGQEGHLKVGIHPLATPELALHYTRMASRKGGGA
jgi:threonine dehydrogenase-like Zn-dependent dehydrogenase